MIIYLFIKYNWAITRSLKIFNNLSLFQDISKCLTFYIDFSKIFFSRNISLNFFYWNDYIYIYIYIYIIVSVKKKYIYIHIYTNPLNKSIEFSYTTCISPKKIFFLYFPIWYQLFKKYFPCVKQNLVFFQYRNNRTDIFVICSLCPYYIIILKLFCSWISWRSQISGNKWKVNVDWKDVANRRTYSLLYSCCSMSPIIVLVKLGTSNSRNAKIILLQLCVLYTQNSPVIKWYIK